MSTNKNHRGKQTLKYSGNRRNETF